jgi:pimeloyl-ACP methyl ester carboxylesterase
MDAVTRPRGELRTISRWNKIAAVAMRRTEGALTRRLVLGVAVAVLTVSCATIPMVDNAREARRPPAIQLSACPLPRSTDTVLCGTHEVFEDRASQAGRRIALNIVVLPATGPAAAPDPLFVLIGGPGLGAASLVTGATATSMQVIRRDRDLVFVDQRGTGKSAAHACPFAEGTTMQRGFNDLFPPDEVRACRERLDGIADVRLYTTPIAMDDLDEVRAALGYDAINLYGISYGAHAALQYLRQHPRRVRSMTIVGVSTPAAKQPLTFARAAQDAMDRLIEDCGADTACRRAFPSLAADFETVLRAFDNGPVTFQMVNPARALTETVSMSRGVFVERLRLMLYDLESASRVPYVIHRAAHGDWLPFATRSPTGVAAGVSAMYLTVTCSETMPRITEEDVVRESRDTFVGEYRTRTHMRACAQWPRGDVPPAFYEPVRGAAPVLMLSGELDPATPPHLATTAARALPNSRQVVIRNAAHAYWYGCMQTMVAEFVAKASARDLDIACVRELRRPPFITG